MRPTAKVLGVYFAILVTTPVYAGADLAARRTNISIAENMRDQFQQIRDQIVLGDQGILDQTREWKGRADGWLTSLDAVWSDLAAQPPQDTVQLKQTMNGILEARQADLDQLLSDAAQIETRALNAKQQLVGLSQPDWGHLIYADQLKSIISAANTMGDNMQTVNDQLVEKGDKLMQIMVPVRRKVQLKLEQLTVQWQVTGWQTAQSKLATMFASEQILDPLTREVAQKTTAVRLLAADKKVFAAKKLLTQVTPFCTKTEATIKDENLPQDDIDFATKAVERDCNDASQVALVMSTSLQTERFYTVAMVATLSARLRDRCGKSDHLANCALASWLVRIPTATISMMTEAQLNMLENAWIAAESNSQPAGQ